MALALCLTLLPAPAWAAEADAPEGGAAQVTTADGTESRVAQLITADNAEQNYESFTDAWSAAIESAGSTLKLLSDVTLPKGENGLSVSEGSFTLDLNNKTLKGAIWNQLLTVSGTANITIQNGSLVNTQPGFAGAVGSENLVALEISGGTVALDNVNLTSGINSEDKYAPALYITGGSLTVNGSTFTGEVMVLCENSDTRPALRVADATLNNGILYGVGGAQASDVAGLKAIFADGSMLFDQNGKYIDLANKEYWKLDEDGACFVYTNECAVKPHTHKVVNGACECGATFAASVTQNGTVTYYKDFNTALNAAKAGDTLTLLTNLTGGFAVTIDKAITLDLNGHEISYDLTVNCKITLKDSAGGTGKIALWLRVENDLTIGDLLEPGYALRNADTKEWYKETYATVNRVTVQQVPITNVTLTALNADGTAASTSIPYGTTGGIKLSASCTTQGAGELLCQWYTIGGTASLIEDAKGAEYTLPANLSVGAHKYLVTFTADGYSKSAELTITVTKAAPTGAPSYVSIKEDGRTLADAKLTANEKWPAGKVQWVNENDEKLDDTTVVEIDKEYKWMFTPDNTASYETLSGTVVLYTKSAPVTPPGGGSSSGGSSSGGSSSSSGSSTVTTETTKNHDGSTTKTETKKDGTVIETTTGKDGSVTKTETKKDGSVTKTETKPDGSVTKTATKSDGSSVTEIKAADGSTGTVKTDENGKTEASVNVSSNAVEEAKTTGNAVQIPAMVAASRNSNTAPTVEINLPMNAGETKVEIPVSNVNSGTVAVLVHADGTEEILKDSIPTKDGIQLTVNGSATVKIVDNSKDFIDTQNHWAKDAICFVSARGLVSGMNETTYAPDSSTTRAQLWTILARQNDANLNGGDIWYEKAQNWAKEKGISDGANPNGTINRAQMVTMLWRATGSPAAQSGTAFQDVAAGSYYGDAVDWAVAHGITAGVGGGRFDPNSTCTRGQIATFLWRAMAE